MATKLLTHDEWKEKKLPLSFAKIENSGWSQIHREMIVKWIESHTGKGWAYYDGSSTYAFESQGDYMAFIMWIKSDPFKSGEGTLEDEEE